MLDSIRTFVGADGAVLLSWREAALASVVSASPERPGERSARLLRAALLPHDGAILDANQSRALIGAVAARTLAMPPRAAVVSFVPTSEGSELPTTALILLWHDGAAVSAERLQALRPLLSELLESDTTQRRALDALHLHLAEQREQQRERARVVERQESNAVRPLRSISAHAVGRPSLLAVDEFLQSVELVLTEALDAGWTLSLHADAVGARVWMNEKLLSFVLADLVAMACASQPDGGVVTVRSARVAAVHGVPSGVQESTQWIAISLSNGDARIPTAVHDDLYQPFASVAAQSGRVPLGLETIATIVERAGGTIRYAVGPSTIWTYTLYLDDADTRIPSQRQETPSRGVWIASALAELPILVVDDDEGPRRVVRRVLEREGYEVIAAESAVEALRQLESHEGQLFGVVSDFLMPGMSGMELLMHIRGRWPDLPVVLVSGFTSNDVTGGALRDLRAHFLPKPFTRDELLFAVRTARAMHDVT